MAGFRNCAQIVPIERIRTLNLSTRGTLEVLVVENVGAIKNPSCFMTWNHHCYDFRYPGSNHISYCCSFKIVKELYTNSRVTASFLPGYEKALQSVTAFPVWENIWQNFWTASLICHMSWNISWSSSSRITLLPPSFQLRVEICRGLRRPGSIWDCQIALTAINIFRQRWQTRTENNPEIPAWSIGA